MRLHQCLNSISIEASSDVNYHNYTNHFAYATVNTHSISLSSTTDKAILDCTLAKQISASQYMPHLCIGLECSIDKSSKDKLTAPFQVIDVLWMYKHPEGLANKAVLCWYTKSSDAT